MNQELRAMYRLVEKFQRIKQEEDAKKPQMGRRILIQIVIIMIINHMM